jgi:hypothetical protein
MRELALRLEVLYLLRRQTSCSSRVTPLRCGVSHFYRAAFFIFSFRECGCCFEKVTPVTFVCFQCGGGEDRKFFVDLTGA